MLSSITSTFLILEKCNTNITKILQIEGIEPSPDTYVIEDIANILRYVQTNK
jgi:hypothetical protein